ncbi:ABC transporter substrate-binding protein [Dongia rigui]|uniref:ABC transporter substrate-binding protein n=1 Tax=Dongia rigui TaxID=940149 RepID=A0ABU5E1E7_9PROT|nr:ABC transporter substrate-binding protein [Dongia rigui]MDY0873375.1 ABC transporter substrate-binding protein [Dongia rigui]
MMIPFRLLAVAAGFAALVVLPGSARAEIKAELAANYIRHLFDTSMRENANAAALCPSIAQFGRFAAGHAWRLLPPSERPRLADGFCNLAVDAVTRLHLTYPGLRLKLDRTLPAAQGMVLVSSSVTRPTDLATWPVEWQLATTGADLRLADLRILGLSLGIFLRSLANAGTTADSASADVILARWRQALDRALPPK